MEEMVREKRYTYEDYASWETDERYELIDGVPYLMAAPSFEHQDICAELLTQFRVFLKGKTCKAIAAPLDVRLNVHDGDDTVVQPDLLVVCDRSKIDEKGVNGAPDLAVEILSPSSGNKDGFLKYQKYLRAGVREYWIVDPESKTVHVHLLNGGTYIGRMYEGGEPVPVHVLEGCAIDLAAVFGT